MQFAAPQQGKRKTGARKGARFSFQAFVFSAFSCYFLFLAIRAKDVGVAQLVEHRTHKPGVVGSIPTPDTSGSITTRPFQAPMRPFLLFVHLWILQIWLAGIDLSIRKNVAMSARFDP